MLTLNDGRSELWQWDTSRKLAVDADCSQVHFSNKVFGRSIDVDVVDGVAVIPDILLQTDKDLNVWAFVGTAENGYTKISKTFKVNWRNKPADYVFTPPEQTSLEEILEKIDYLEAIQDPDAIKNAVDDYLANNPIMVKETDPTVPEWAKQPTPPDVKIPDKLPNPHSITFTGAVDASYDGSNPVEIKIPDSGGNVALTADQIAALDGMFKVCGFIKDDISAEYNAFRTAFGIGDSGEVEPDTPDEPDVPVVPDEPEAGVSNETTWTSGVPYTFEPISGSYPDKSTGAIKDYANWERSPYLYCAGASTLRGVVKHQSTVLNGTNDNAFYDADKNYVAPVETFTFKALNDAEAGTYIDIPIPENAAYFIVSGGNHLLSGANATNNEPYIEYVPIATGTDEPDEPNDTSIYFGVGRAISGIKIQAESFASSSKRAIAFQKSGVYPYQEVSGQGQWLGYEVYPIAIPRNATSVSIICPGFIPGVQLLSVTSSGGEQIADPGWQSLDASTYDLSAYTGQITHIGIGFKNSSNSAIDTAFDFSGFSITFS